MHSTDWRRHIPLVYSDVLGLTPVELCGTHYIRGSPSINHFMHVLCLHLHSLLRPGWLHWKMITWCSSWALGLEEHTCSGMVTCDLPLPWPMIYIYIRAIACTTLIGDLGISKSLELCPLLPLDIDACSCGHSKTPCYYGSSCCCVCLGRWECTFPGCSWLAILPSGGYSKHWWLLWIVHAWEIN